MWDNQLPPPLPSPLLSHSHNVRWRNSWKVLHLALLNDCSWQIFWRLIDAETRLGMSQDRLQTKFQRPGLLPHYKEDGHLLWALKSKESAAKFSLHFTQFLALPFERIGFSYEQLPLKLKEIYCRDELKKRLLYTKQTCLLK